MTYSAFDPKDPHATRSYAAKIAWASWSRQMVQDLLPLTVEESNAVITQLALLIRELAIESATPTHRERDEVLDDAWIRIDDDEAR